jgi:TolB-like protein/Tfp pilus assembly protein PilF
LTEPSHAVFLSYASQDTEAAARICNALRAAGIEVWFDQRELRGGDVWDQKIRREIQDCVLFVPLISVNTASRHEGYFRLEWDIADQRTHRLARNRPFILPVCLDATPNSSADVPESFRRVQWTRLPDGQTPREFVRRIEQLLSGHAVTTTAAPEIGRRSRSAWLAVALASVAVVAYCLIERPWIVRSPLDSAVAQPARSIAVLPFVNMSDDQSQQYFSDGVSEDLIVALSQFPGLKVIGHSSSFQFRDSKADSRSIGAKLGVAHLLEGSVRRSGDMVRVSAELINTEDGSAQWSERYDRPYKELFALQDEITRAVAMALRTKLMPDEHASAQSDKPPSGNLDAYNALLQGRFYYSRITEADMRKAIEYYTQATELDPSYALAWSWVSRTWSNLSADFLEGTPAQSAYAKARAAADRALTLSPDLAFAHLAKADLLEFADFDWRGAEAEYRKALALAPNDAPAQFGLGQLLANLGDADQAIELTRQALSTEPLRANVYYWLGTYYLGIDRLDEAEQATRRAIELQPAAQSFHAQLAIIEIKRGRAQLALAAAQQEPDGPWKDVALALAQQIGRDPSAADAALRTLIDKNASLAPYQIAQVYALRNDATETFAWLDRAWTARDSGIQYLLLDPFILRYRDDPRLAAFCRKVGLPDAARSHGTLITYVSRFSNRGSGDMKSFVFGQNIPTSA